MNTKIHYHKAIDPRVWDTFIHASPQGSPFVLYEYMHIIHKDWRAIIVEEKGKWQAVMPLAISKKWKYQAILQPFFAQYWGICFAPFSEKMTYQLYSQQKRYCEAILKALNKFHLFSINFSPNFTYPLPFHWNHYKLNTRYTYQISLEPEIDFLHQQLASPLKRQINKARRNQLLIMPLVSPAPFLKLIRKNKEEGKNILGNAFHSINVLEELIEYILDQKTGILWGIKNQEGELIATSLYLYYHDITYYLHGAYHPSAHNSGAMSFLMWEAIVNAKEEGFKVFDFEGSMIVGIEAFFRKFGAYPVSYLHIHRNQLPILIKWIRELR